MSKKRTFRAGLIYFLSLLFLLTFLSACEDNKEFSRNATSKLPEKKIENKIEIKESPIEAEKLAQSISIEERSSGESASSASFQEKSENEEERKDESFTEGLTVHFIDVGQGESILIDAQGQHLLIDAGDRDHGSIVVRYLKDQGVESLKYVIATHPHEDHIGGMQAVFQAFPVENVILPNVAHNSRTFEQFLDSIRSRKIHPIKAEKGVEFDLGEAHILLLGPSVIVSDSLNNNSVVSKITFGKTSFLFTGDAEREEEATLKNFDLHADVLNVGHHGSKTSTGSVFLRAVNPTYAVISCGPGNSYGYPHQGVLRRLSALNVDIYRTDLCGTIVARSDGKKVQFSALPVNDEGLGSSAKTSVEKNEFIESSPQEFSSLNEAQKGDDFQEEASIVQEEAPKILEKKIEPTSQEVPPYEGTAPYIGNRNSSVFHHASCPSVDKMKESNKVPLKTREEAVNQNFRPCKNCMP